MDLLSWCGFCSPCCGAPIPLFLAVIAIVTGVIGRSQEDPPTTMSTAGIGLGILDLVLAIGMGFASCAANGMLTAVSAMIDN